MLEDLRKLTQNRGFMASVEKVILESVATRKRLAIESQRLAAIREKLD